MLHEQRLPGQDSIQLNTPEPKIQGSVTSRGVQSPSIEDRELTPEELGVIISQPEGQSESFDTQTHDGFLQRLSSRLRRSRMPQNYNEYMAKPPRYGETQDYGI